MQRFWLNSFLMVICMMIADSFQKKVKIEGYLHPNYYWPFDYSTWVRELIENKNPIVNGDKQLGITGKKPGFCQFDVSSSSAKLGSFTFSCLSDQSKCHQGITIAFWVAMENLQHNTDGPEEQFLLLHTSVSSSSSAPALKIWITVNSSGVVLHSMVNHEKSQHAKLTIDAVKWSFVVLQFSVKQGLNFYVNMVKGRPITAQGGASSSSKVDLILGQYPSTQGIGKALNKASVKIDNLAIWRRLLSQPEIEAIYLAEMGTIVPSCVHKSNNQKKKHFQLQWMESNDYYKHITSYHISYTMLNSLDTETNISVPLAYFKTGMRKDSNGGNKILLPLEIYETSSTFNISVMADTVSKISFGKSAQCKSPSSSEGNLFRIKTPTPSSMRFIWNARPHSARPHSAYSTFIISAKRSSSQAMVTRLQGRTLNFTLTELQPSSMYDILIKKTETDTGLETVHHTKHNTSSMMGMFNTSVVSLQLVDLTWNEAKLKFNLHSALKEFPMVYKLLQKNLDHPQDQIKILNIPLQYYAQVELDIKGLHENTNYEFDVQLSDPNSKELGPKLAEKLLIKTKERFMVPEKISVQNVTSSSIILNIMLHNETLDQRFNVSHLKITIQMAGASTQALRILPIKALKIDGVVLDSLQQYTVYNITIATGNGASFGKSGTSILVTTLDENECARTRNVCGRNKKCFNTPGSFECRCKKGFLQRNDACVDTDECSQNDDLCGNHSRCLNTRGSYQCKCIFGFERENNSCVDVNECSSGKEACSANSVCVNTLGSFVCNCHSGFEKNGSICQDINECTRNTCGANEICFNKPGSYKCICEAGYYQKENGTCTDIDECSSPSKLPNCKSNEICINKLGSYDCACQEGYRQENDSCIDVNECNERNICGINADCVNTNGSYICTCVKGFKRNKDSNKCKDVNECLVSGICGLNEICNNKRGSYDCACQEGYRRGNHSCIDMNECNERNICGINADCVNTNGSYICTCVQGFKKDEDSKKCKDVNECLVSGICGLNKICENKRGSYQCACQDGYYRHNDSCIVVVESDVCASEMKRKIMWKTTKSNMFAVARCPKGSTGNATRKCRVSKNGNGGKWQMPDLSNCLSDRIFRLKQYDITNADISTMATDIQSVISEEEMYGGDVSLIVDLMNNLMSVESKAPTQFTETMMTITSSLLNTTDAWHDLPLEKRTNDAVQLLETTDAVIEKSATNLSPNKTSRTIVTENIVMRLKKLTPKTKQDSISLAADNSVELPYDALSADEDFVTAAMVTYNSLGQLIGVPENSQVKKSKGNFTMNSKIMSISLFPLKKKEFEKPVVFVQELLEHHTDDFVPNCVYWHKEDNQSGFWSDRGCNVHHSNTTHVTCHCYHLTNFAILMSVTKTDKLNESNQLALSLITIIGISISLAALVASFFTFVLIRVIRSFRNTIHQHLVIALFLAEALFLLGVERTENKIACQVIAASLHYFFLVSFFIMALEGIVLYLMLVRVYRSMGTTGYGSTKYVALCWVLPFIFIMVNLVINKHAYALNQEYCWLSVEHGFIWSFVGPVIFIVMGNLIILLMALRVMANKSKKRNCASQEVWFWMKGCCLLLCILGITWAVGIFYVNTETLFAAYVFNIVNSLQGLSIFIFHCVCDPRVRKEYYNFICCMRQKALIRSQSRTRTTSTGSKASLRKSKSKAKYVMTNEKGEKMPLYMNGQNDVSTSNGRSSSTPDDSFGVLVGTNKF